MRPFFLTLLLAVCSLHVLHAQTNSKLIAAADLYKKGEYEKALPLFEKCLAEAEQSKDSAAQVNIYDHIGHVYSQMGKAAEALDGCGLDTSVIFSGNGMKNIKHRIHELAGNLDIRSTTGNGTLFSYSFPI